MVCFWMGCGCSDTTTFLTWQAFSRGFNGQSQQVSGPDSAGRRTPTSPRVEGDGDKKQGPSFRLDTAMNDFITAVQSDLEVCDDPFTEEGGYAYNSRTEDEDV